MEKIKNISKKLFQFYIDVQYFIVLKIILFFYPQSTPEKANEKISAFKSNSLSLLKKYSS